MTDDIMHRYRATETREILDRLQNENVAHTENVPETIEGFAKAVVEGGTFWPDCRVAADVSLTPRERITGERTQDVTAMLCIGMMLGSALERDVPMETPLELAWKNGIFELPESGE